MTRLTTLLAGASLAALLAACGETVDEAATNAAAPAAASETQSGDGAETETATSESERLNAWFEEQFEARLARSPMFQTYLGRKTNYGQWDDASPEFREETYEMEQAAIEEMRERFDYDALDEDAQLSWRLAEYNAENDREGWPYRDHRYVFTQRSGPHSGVPAFLINQHRVDTVDDAEAYIERIVNAESYLDQNAANAEARFEDGVHPPLWTYAQMIQTSRNVISGAPFDESGEDSPLLADFRGKVEALDISDEDKADLIARAETALTNSLQPAYERLIAMFQRQSETASSDDGVWKLPDGAAYYDWLLSNYTTTDMTAEEIHQLGLSEVERIHGEMRAIMEQVQFDGSLQDFFEFMRTDEQFYYSNTPEGREAYLAEATALIDTMREALPDWFDTLPEADIVVRRVEPFREASAGKAFYQRPAPNGSRPGVYYANLRDMAEMPTYQMEALAYHEGIPGHHMQLAIMQELEDVPSFRRFGGFTAYTEGWGLYSEYLPKEMGFYEDPYSDFGRLAMELWRAARLVVDTGLHHHRWTREEAIDYLLENTPNPEGDAINAIERYIVFPGQATAYKIGMNEILSLREEARAELGEDFDIGEFHDVVLSDGAVPLEVLGELVEDWIVEVQAQDAMEAAE
ncbi:DUF885 domain-containing protein [Marinicauda salina]|uniref:DUF885 domain-containing protein n=1 Tax=Marinicauda salina TaxID=2135793 RepID=A0A2U2BU72_9PROT|nr:DUF885 domain-containing protein [Marinicauda salina]PWE17542.1 DUF885 domain-containing protein [Marinicauda salina]